jgi:hypothetical protein
MSIDLSMLTAAPWHADRFYVKREGDDGEVVASCLNYNTRKYNTTDPAFIALARNAFDVMMRRGWGITKFDDGWMAVDDDDMIIEPSTAPSYADPFTALLEADKWHTENVEKK